MSALKISVTLIILSRFHADPQQNFNLMRPKLVIQKALFTVS